MLDILRKLIPLPLPLPLPNCFKSTIVMKNRVVFLGQGQGHGQGQGRALSDAVK